MEAHTVGLEKIQQPELQLDIFHTVGLVGLHSRFG